MKRPELLSPAGNKECLIAAIKAGCDAVYLGGYTFGARNYAGNFSDEELIEAIKYAHIYGVKVYVTVNTMIYEDEVERFVEYIDFLHRNNVDAIIIQDLGMMDLVRKTYPNLEIHASTQMNVHNIEGAKLLKDLGLKRVVLARETSIDTIKEIKNNTDIEIEVFIQGALCLSYSGECLMSSLIGGRSGNRGTCSQCCRMEYDLISDNQKINKDRYLLSTKDLNTLDNIKELIELGIESFKIEGRMKRPEYVYLMTSIYRKAIDNVLNNIEPVITNQDIIEMKKIFNREFTKGFIFNEKIDNIINQKRPNHIGIEIGKVIEVGNKVKIKLTDNIVQGDGIRIIGKKDTGCILNKIYQNKKLVNSALSGEIIEIELKDRVNVNDIVVKTTDKLQIDDINEQLKIERKVPIKATLKCKLNQPLELTLTDGKNGVSVKDYSVQKALNQGTSKQRIEEQIKKLGDTPFTLESLDTIIDEDIFVKISELNELRRRAIQLLTQKRIYEIPYQKEQYHIDLKNYPETKNYSVLINSEEDYEVIKNKNIENIYIEEPLYSEINDDRKVLRLPRVNEKLIDTNNKLLIGDLGSLYKYPNKITDFNFNVANSYTVAFLHSLGVEKVTLSYELNKEQIKTMIDNYHTRYDCHPNLELIISSYPEAMISKFDLLKYYHINNGYLKDKFNNKFKLKSKDNIMTIYHYEKIELTDNYFDLGINSLRIHIEDKDDYKKIL